MRGLQGGAVRADGRGIVPSRAAAAASVLHTAAGAPSPSPVHHQSRRLRHTVLQSALRQETNTKQESTVHQQPQERRRAARSPSELQDPARIGATGSASVSTNAYPGAVCLDSYMLLPVEQYFVLDPKQIRHLGANRFLLLVPRINILNVWLEPEVEISVSTIPALQPGQSPKVVLQAEHCRIRGSDLVESLRLDQRFCMRFVTELTWSTTPGPPAQGLPSALNPLNQLNALNQQQQQQQPAAQQQQQQQGFGAGWWGGGGAGQQAAGAGASQQTGAAWDAGVGGGGLVSGASSSGSSWDDGPLAPVGSGTIKGEAQLDVWCEVIPPFNLMPREALQSTCNVVMRGLVGTLLPLFLRNLGADYQAWATQPAYRASRAQRSKPLA